MAIWKGGSGMPLSIGIDHTGPGWKTCLLENGEASESFSYEDTSSALAYVRNLCALYPELTLALALSYEAPFIAAGDFTDFGPTAFAPCYAGTGNDRETQEFLIAVKSINLHSYVIPSVRYIPSVPPFRAARRSSLGCASAVCGAAALLYRLREREAAWPEIRFLFVQLYEQRRSVQVVFEGYLVDGFAGDLDLSTKENDEQLVERATWEGLTRDLGGLMALHHVEDIVLVGSQYEQAFNEHFAEIYPVYLFPYHPKDIPGFEVALGAAVIAEGLYHPGLAGEVVARLGIREAVDRG